MKSLKTVTFPIIILLPIFNEDSTGEDCLGRARVPSLSLQVLARKHSSCVAVGGLFTLSLHTGLEHFHPQNTYWSGEGFTLFSVATNTTPQTGEIMKKRGLSSLTGRAEGQ